MLTTILTRAINTNNIWVSWLLVYVILTVTQSLTIERLYGIDAYFLNGGILLAALLDLNLRGIALKQLVIFCALIFAVDWLVKSSVGNIEFHLASYMAFTIVLQGYLGVWLLQQAGLNSSLPDTPKSIILFAWYTAILPVVASSAMLVVATAIAQPGGDLMSPGEEFVWWFISRLASVILVAPAVLLGLRQYSQQHKLGCTYFGKEFWWLALSALLCAYVIFSVANPAGRTLATYSYLLLPVMLVIAMRLPLFQGMLILLLVSVVCFWADASDYQTSDQARRSFMAVAVFLMITGGIIWLVGALISERALALKKEKAQTALFEMLSRVNQTIIKDKLDKESLFSRVCSIIVEESDFQKACVIPYGFSEAAAGKGETTAKNNNNIVQCKLIDVSVREKTAVFFQSCKVCPEFAKCNFNSVHQGSMAAFPIHQRDTIIAVLAVFGGSHDAFDDNHLRLFQEMADDIGFTVDMYEGQQRLKQVAKVFQHSRESIIITDKEGNILNVNPSFSRITGYSREEAIGVNPRVLKSGQQDNDFYKKLFEQLNSEGYWSGQFWNKRKNGELYLQRGTISAVMGKTGQPEHYIAVMEDASTHNEAEQKIHSLANYDQLTGLPNRTLLSDRFNQALADARRHGQIWCLMFIDLDDFKQVNDALGHHIGDELLKEVSLRLKSYIRDYDTLCRFGGDEFILLMRGRDNDAAELARRLIDEISQTYEIQGVSLQIGASIGISVLFQDGENLEDLIQASDTAMYQAKAEGRGCFRFFAKTMQSKVQIRLELKHTLKKAIAENEFCLFYQPKVALTKDGNYERVGYEALVRWNDPLTGLVSPASFIPAAEESGQIAEIDRWVLKNAIGQLKNWLQQKSINVLPVAINLSASLFSKDGFVDELSILLHSSGIPANLIELEITEHVATYDINKTLATLNELKKIGVGLAIDDFGTGYSSLSYLQQFPIDYLKIDMSFVRNVHDDQKKQGLVKAIITMAHALGLKTIAEGVEVADEQLFLALNGCNQYQGYYFGKPIPADQL